MVETVKENVISPPDILALATGERAIREDERLFQYQTVTVKVRIEKKVHSERVANVITPDAIGFYLTASVVDAETGKALQEHDGTPYVLPHTITFQLVDMDPAADVVVDLDREVAMLVGKAVSWFKTRNDVNGLLEDWKAEA